MELLKSDAKINLKSDKRSLETKFIPVLEKISNHSQCGSKLIHIHKDQFTIGRKPDNDEVILDVLISRNHCVLHLDKNNENWFVTNLSSTDTLLNNNPIARNETKILKIGDILQLSLSDNYKYQFTLVEKEYESIKHQRRSSESTDDLRIQKEVLVCQENEKKNLEEELLIKHKEHQKLKQDLQKLLEEEKVTKDCNQSLNNQISELVNKIETVNSTEFDLKEKYKNLLEKYEEEQRKSAIKFAEEKEKWQKILEESKQEKKQLEMTMTEQMEEWRVKLEKKKQEEWQQKKDNLLQEEKIVQMKLWEEKNLLEQKYKELAENLKEKEQAEQQKVQLVNPPSSVEVDDNKDKKEKNNFPILATIDLTEDDAPAISVVDEINNPNAVIDKVYNIMDEQLTCCICSELFVTAMTLECTHTFCRNCIDQWFKKRKDCPNCRAKITIMTRALVLDNFIEKMIESLSPEDAEKRKLLVEERKKIPLVKYKKKVYKKR